MKCKSWPINSKRKSMIPYMIMSTKLQAVHPVFLDKLNKAEQKARQNSRFTYLANKSLHRVKRFVHYWIRIRRLNLTSLRNGSRIGNHHPWMEVRTVMATFLHLLMWKSNSNMSWTIKSWGKIRLSTPSSTNLTPMVQALLI